MSRRVPPQSYPHGEIYRAARGRYAPRAAVEDLLAPRFAVVDLEDVDADIDAPAFLARIERELKIRYYQRRTRDSYRQILETFLQWLALPPAQATREHVRQWLELLVDGGAASAWVSVQLSCLRTAFDKMCGRDVTCGLLTPRRPARIPVVLAPEEVRALLEAAPSVRDKLLLGIMYATGMRVSEVVRLRHKDIDFARGCVRVEQGKGRKDREVPLPTSFVPLLQRLGRMAMPDQWLFASEEGARRHICSRTAQRAMQRAVQLARIGKDATCHSLRHSFATHLLEHGTDVRFIQRMLGHVRLETTTLYLRLARPSAGPRSPLDWLESPQSPDAPRAQLPSSTSPVPPRAKDPSVGRMRVELEAIEASAWAVRVIIRADPDVTLDGMTARMARPGFVSLELPPLEDWAERLLQLSREERERVEQAGFYERVVDVVRARLARSAP